MLRGSNCKLYHCSIMANCNKRKSYMDKFCTAYEVPLLGIHIIIPNVRYV